MKFKAVIFDLDGTLLDTIKDIADSMNAVLLKLGFSPHRTEDYYYFVGEGMKALCEKVIPPGHKTSELITRCVELMKIEYERRWFNNTRPYPGIPELLDDLQKMGIKMAVHSNKPDEFTKLFIHRLFPDVQFSIVLGEKAGLARKPAPDGALYIAEVLKVQPEETVYLGDSEIDMKTAISAGMYPVGALWGFRTAGELINAGARRLLKAPLDLLTIDFSDDLCKIGKEAL
ncbi:MAG: HAD family hydrolase [candidate division WOR-3 bacterium]